MNDERMNMRQVFIMAVTCGKRGEMSLTLNGNLYQRWFGFDFPQAPFHGTFWFNLYVGLNMIEHTV